MAVGGDIASINIEQISNNIQDQNDEVSASHRVGSGLSRNLFSTTALFRQSEKLHLLCLFCRITKTTLLCLVDQN